MRGINKTRKRYQAETGVNIAPHLKLHTLYWTEDDEDYDLDYIRESTELRDYIEWLENQSLQEN